MRPSTTTAAAVSSQDVSMPKMGLSETLIQQSFGNSVGKVSDKNAGEASDTKKGKPAPPIEHLQNGKPVWVRQTTISARESPRRNVNLLIGLGNIPARTDFAVVDTQIKPAIGVVAHPRFIHNGCALASII